MKDITFFKRKINRLNKYAKKYRGKEDFEMSSAYYFFDTICRYTRISKRNPIHSFRAEEFKRNLSLNYTKREKTVPLFFARTVKTVFGLRLLSKKYSKKKGFWGRSKERKAFDKCKVLFRCFCSK